MLHRVLLAAPSAAVRDAKIRLGARGELPPEVRRAHPLTESDLFTKYQITALPQVAQSARRPWVLLRPRASTA